MPGFHAPAGTGLIASSSAAVIIHPQVNSTFRRPSRSASRCLTRSWLAPAPSTRTRIFRRNRAGTCRQGRGQHVLVIGERVRPGVAGAQQHRQALARIRAPGPQRVETVAFLPGGAAPSLSERAVTSVASMSMTSQPARVFPATASHGNPARGLLDQLPHVRPGFRPGRRDPLQHAAVPARSRARRMVGPLGGAPSSGARCASTAMSLMLVAPSAIAAAIETSAIPRSEPAMSPPSAAPGTRRGQAHLVGGLAEQDRARVADQARPAAVTFRAWSHRVSCMAKSAPVREVATCGNLQSPRTRALFALKPASTPRRPAPKRCAAPNCQTARNPQVTTTRRPPDRSTGLQR